MISFLGDFTIKEIILEKIKEYDTITVFRHSRPDGDAIGSSGGLCEILRKSFPEKKVYSVNTDNSDHLSFTGVENDEVDDVIISISLAIVVDTASSARVSDKRFLNAAEIIRIDHHVEVERFGSISWVDEFRSSCCEMIAEFALSFPNTLKLTQRAAELLYTGMVTDTGRFKFGPTTALTHRIAGELLDFGINTDRLFSYIYLDSFDFLKFKSFILSRIRQSENGVAYIHVTRYMQEKYGLNWEDASSVVSFMESIKGSIIWIAFIDNMPSSGTDGIRVRLRSRFVSVNNLAEKYGGGGHANAAGAKIRNIVEMRKLLRDADELIGGFKLSGRFWL